MIHVLQFLLKLLLSLERGLEDNSKLVGSLFIGGFWLLLLAELFPAQLGIWSEWFVWGGWISIGIAVFLFARRKIWVWRGRNRIAKRRGSLFRA
jgi:hypothetical protein